MIKNVSPNLNNALLICLHVGRNRKRQIAVSNVGNHRKIHCHHCEFSIIKINTGLVTTVARTQPCQHKENKLRKGMVESLDINDIALTVNARYSRVMWKCDAVAL
jgi:hypothetical protein